ncbi:MAG: hypothetical protein WBL19_01485 [Minisyncoccia bacterium]
MIEEFISLFQTDLYLRIWGYVAATWPIWLPIAMFSLFMNTWLSYKRREWIRSKGAMLLEIKLPKEIERSPAAMEVVFNGLHEGVVGSLTDVYLNGRVRSWFSFEIVSLGGEVKFFIWAFPQWKSIIESRIYAQYPGVEIFEAQDDYALKVIYDPKRMDIWGATIKLNKADAYPIKTYIDYELDRGGKEPEEIVDPIMPVLEQLGSLKPGEQAWFQILVQAHRKEGFKDTRIFPKSDWQEGIKKEITKIIEKESFTKPTKATGDKDSMPYMTFLTRTQDKTIEAIERNAAKPAFDTMIRVLYTAPIGIFSKGRIGGLLGSLRQFGSQSLNSFRPDWMLNTDYEWEDFRNFGKKRNSRTLLEAYKRRSFFNVPFKHLRGKPFILTAEELATIYHFPGRAITTPTLARVPSKKATAPPNLPVKHLEVEDASERSPN